MKILGIHFSMNSDGKKVTTLHVGEEFGDYFKDKDSGRGCAGLRVETIYVGTYDCSALKVGSEIEVYYDKAMTTKNGTYSPIKKIEVVTKKRLRACHGRGKISPVQI